MKTLQDCKERIARYYRYRSWKYLYADYARTNIEPFINQAAELYHRYGRLYARWQLRQELESLDAWDENWPDSTGMEFETYHGMSPDKWTLKNAWKRSSDEQ